MSNDRAFAHAKSNQPRNRWHPLEEHLREVGRLAGSHASKWGALDFGFLAGLWHDLGKYAPDWQRFLAEAGEEAPVLGEEQPDESRDVRRKRGPDHSTAGAVHASEIFGETAAGISLQFVIAAHHAGLADREGLRNRVKDPAKVARYQASLAETLDSIRRPGTVPISPGFIEKPESPEAKRRRFDTFIRMLFSALIDADHLDTERFFDRDEPPDTARWSRRAAWGGVEDYLDPLDDHLRVLEAQAAPTLVNEHNRAAGLLGSRPARGAWIETPGSS